MIKTFLKNLLAAFLISFAALLILAFFVHRFHFGEKTVNIVIPCIYVLSCLIAGILLGKRVEKKKYLWGLSLGGCYFLVLLLASLLAFHSIQDVAGDFFSSLLICIGSGMVGGMLG